MEEYILGAMERLSKAQNDIWYATLYSQEEQDEDIKILLKEYKNLQQIEQEHRKENGALREIIKELEQNQCTHNIDNECIRKSKVKEMIECKIEELFEEMEECNIYDEEDNEEKRQLSDMIVLLKEVLQQLLEE